MLSAIRMDIYRMFHTKSLYIIWFVMAAAVLFSTAMSKEDYNSMQQTTAEQTISGQSQETVNLGMEVTIPTKAGTKVALFDQVFANLQGKFITLFLVIFSVIFSTADSKSGYIKHIGGQVRHRRYLIFSKSIVLSAYTAISMLFYLLIQAVFQKFYFGYLILGNTTDFWKYFGTQFLLNTAMVLICMAIAVIIHSNVFSMTLSVCMCMNILIILYSGIDKILSHVGIKDFQTISHTVTGKITLLSMNANSDDIWKSILTAVVFGALAIILSCTIFEKRDIQ